MGLLGAGVLRRFSSKVAPVFLFSVATFSRFEM